MKMKNKSNDSSSNVNNYIDCGETNQREEIKEEESVDDPLPIHQDNENKEEDLYDYDTIDIEEFKIEPDNVDINDITNEEQSDQNNVNNENNVMNNGEENVAGQENINYEALQNLSVDEALAFFSS